MILNRIILKNPNNDISLKANPKGFQRLQNTSNVSNSNIQPNNNIFNEIKNENLKDEIHKIINTSSSLDSGRRRKKNSDLELNKNIDKEDKKVLDNNNKQMSDIIEEDNNQINTYTKGVATNQVSTPSIFIGLLQNLRLSPSTGTLLAKKENSPLSNKFPSSSVTLISNTRMCFPVLSFIHSQ